MKILLIILVFLSANAFCQKSSMLAIEKNCDSTVLAKYQFDTVSYMNNIYRYHFIGGKKISGYVNNENGQPIYRVDLVIPDFLFGMDSEHLKLILKLISDRNGIAKFTVFRNYCAYEYLYRAIKLSDKMEERKDNFLARNYFGEFEFK